MSQLSTAHPGQRGGDQDADPFEPFLLEISLLIRNCLLLFGRVREHSMSAWKKGRGNQWNTDLRGHPWKMSNESVKHFFFHKYSRDPKILNIKPNKLKIVFQYSIRKYYFNTKQIQTDILKVQSQENFWGSGVSLFIVSAETEILIWLHQGKWILLVFNYVIESLGSICSKRINNYNHDLNILLLQEELMKFCQ